MIDLKELQSVLHNVQQVMAGYSQDDTWSDYDRQAHAELIKMQYLVNGAINEGKMYSGKEVAEMMKSSYKAGLKEIKCNCDNEIKTGQTSVMCCNVCGKPDEAFWSNIDLAEFKLL